MAAPTYDNSASTSGHTVSSLTSASWTIGGSNRYLVGMVHNASGTPASVDPSAMRWGGSGGTLMTKQGSTLQYNGTIRRLSCYTLLAPTAQSSTLYALWSANQENVAISGVSANGVDQTTPLGTVASATGTTATPTVNATTVADDFVVDMTGVWGDGVNPTITVGGGQTSRQEIEGGTYSPDDAVGQSTEVATGTSTTMSWTTAGGVAAWAIFAVPLKPVAAGGNPEGSLLGGKLLRGGLLRHGVLVGSG